MATWAIGDVHGCLDKLERLWERLSPGIGEELVFLGDLIDRGPDSRGVLDFLLHKRRLGFRVVCLLGNHEELCLRWHRDPDDAQAWALWTANGGRQTLESYASPSAPPVGRRPQRLPAEHLAFLEELRPWHRSAGVTFVHAGLRPGTPLERQDRRDLLWIREAFFEHPEAFCDRVVFGHTPFPQIFRNKTLVGIDTGAVYGAWDSRFGKLTAYDPLRDLAVQVV